MSSRGHAISRVILYLASIRGQFTSEGGSARLTAEDTQARIRAHASLGSASTACSIIIRAAAAAATATAIATATATTAAASKPVDGAR